MTIPWYLWALVYATWALLWVTHPRKGSPAWWMSLGVALNCLPK